MSHVSAIGIIVALIAEDASAPVLIPMVITGFIIPYEPGSGKIFSFCTLRVYSMIFSMVGGLLPVIYLT